MGRPLNKRFFGNRNVGTTGTADNGIGGEGVASVTLGGTNSGYTAIPTATFATTPKLPGGVRATGTAVVAVTNTAALTIVSGGTLYAVGDVLTLVGLGDGTAATVTVATVDAPETGVITGVTLTTGGAYTTVVDLTALATTDNSVAGSGATITVTDLKIDSITITEKGSGYTAAPQVTISGTATGTAVLTTDSGALNTTNASTNQQNAIIAYAVTVAEGTNLIADIKKQVSGRRYQVTTSEGTAICKLVTDGVANAVGEMTITATDANGNTYYVSKLTRHKATLVRLVDDGSDNDWLYATGGVAPWGFAAADGLVVQIANA